MSAATQGTKTMLEAIDLEAENARLRTALEQAGKAITPLGDGRMALPRARDIIREALDRRYVSRGGR